MPAEDPRLPMGRSAGLVEILDRILDKGLVIAGDVKVSLADVELLTIRIRVIICSVDKAEKIGMDWWRSDPHFSSYAMHAKGLAKSEPAALPGGAPPALAGTSPADARRIEAKIQELDAKLQALLDRSGGADDREKKTNQPGNA